MMQKKKKKISLTSDNKSNTSWMHQMLPLRLLEVLLEMSVCLNVSAMLAKYFMNCWTDWNEINYFMDIYWLVDPMVTTPNWHLERFVCFNHLLWGFRSFFFFLLVFYFFVSCFLYIDLCCLSDQSLFTWLTSFQFLSV